MQIVLATHNLHKLREFRDLLHPLKHLDVLSLLNFPNYQLPEETGSTFEENATIKAVDAAQKLNAWVIADDSGLIVPALKGLPGLHSSRYAGDDATDAENRQKLLKAMLNLSGMDRYAYFECALALAGPDGLRKCVTGKCEGEIITQERGRHGFGYDPLFVKHDYDKTFAELPDETKNRISHRRKAFERLIPAIESLASIV